MKHDNTREAESRSGGPKDGPRFLRSLKDFIVLTYRHFDSDKCLIMASSIVYTTLISLVPFITFIVSLLSVFGVFNNAFLVIKELLVGLFGEVSGNDLTLMLDQFIRNAGGLGAVGLVSFLLTSIILINRVWIMINQIYRTPIDRNPLARIARFITILVVGTLLLGVYFSVSSLFSGWLLELVGSSLFTLRLYRLAVRFAPWIVTWLLLILLIMAVPSTRVRFSSALLGSVIGTAAFQLANTVFSRFVIRIVNYSVIYGSLASILIMLFWIYILWIIIFAAVEIAYVHQYRPVMGSQSALEEPAARFTADGLDTMAVITRRFLTGGGPVSVKDLRGELAIPDGRLYRYLTLFEEAGLIVRIDRRGREYMPARPPESIGTAETAEVLLGSAAIQRQQSAGEKAVQAILSGGLPAVSSQSAAALVGSQEQRRNPARTNGS
jgi:membrane protein